MDNLIRDDYDRERRDDYSDAAERESTPWWERLDDAIWQGDWFDGASYWVGYAVCVLALVWLSVRLLFGGD